MDPIEHILSQRDTDQLMRVADQLRRRYGTADHRLLPAQAPLIRRFSDGHEIPLRRPVAQ